jgi:GNAT superfamily N-acetyltransferase
VPGERPISTAALVDLGRFTAPPERVVHRLARGAHGQVVGFGEVHWRDGPGSGALRILVDPAHRGHGVAGALGRALAGAARADGRDGLIVEVAVGSPAETIVRRLSLQPDLVTELNRTEQRAIPDALLDAWRRAGESSSGYSLVAFDAPCPSDDLAEAFVLVRHVMNDAPRAESEAAWTFTVDELRALETAADAAHLDWWSVGVRHDATDEVVGLSEMYLPAARPWIVFQGDTGVAPAHRGHGLGAWMKAVLHLRLRAERPATEHVQTWNAAANEPMLRINRALGYVPVQRFQAWHQPLD